MADNDIIIESPPNYETKSICCFVVDVSTSMHGKPIRALNQGLQDFHRDILNDPMTTNRLEIAIVEFSSTVKTRVPPSLANRFSMPTLEIGGTTRLVDGVRNAIELVNNRKEWYKDTGQPYLRPWIILITDGEPDHGQDISGLAQEIEVDTKDKKYVFLSIGVEKANMSILNQIVGFIQNKQGEWNKMQAMKLKGLKFSDFFHWVSASMAVFAGSKEEDEVNLPPPTDWLEGFVI